MSKVDSKYCIREVFNFTIYDKKGNVVYSTDSVVSNEITGGNGIDKLIIEDAMFDCKFAEDVINGLYKDVEVAVEGYTYVRNLIGEDSVLRLRINSAYIHKYEVFGGNSVDTNSKYTHRLIIHFYEDFNNEGIKLSIESMDEVWNT